VLKERACKRMKSKYKNMTDLTSHFKALHLHKYYNLSVDLGQDMLMSMVLETCRDSICKISG
jgi:hypothetical protein